MIDAALEQYKLTEKRHLQDLANGELKIMGEADMVNQNIQFVFFYLMTEQQDDSAAEGRNKELVAFQAMIAIKAMQEHSLQLFRSSGM